MGEQFSFLASPLTSTKIIDDGPLKVAAIQTDGITEKTASNGVQIGSTVKAAAIQTDAITEKTASNGVQFGSTVKADAITEKTASHGVVADIVGMATKIGSSSLGNSATGSVDCAWAPIRDTTSPNQMHGMLKCTRAGTYRLWITLRNSGTITQVYVWTPGTGVSTKYTSIAITNNTPLNVGDVTVAAGDVIVVDTAPGDGIMTLKNSDGYFW